MKFVQLSANLKNNIEKAYLLTGEDAYLKQTAIKLIKNACGTELPDFNQSYFDNENWDISRFSESVNSMPIGNLKKIVIVRNLDKLTEKDKNKIQEEINNLPDTTCLILDINKSFTACAEVDCSTLDNLMLSKFIVNDLAKNGKKISNDALELLIEFCSHNLTKIISELPKLVAYSVEEIISSDIVKQLVTPDEEFQVYELSEALGLKNKTKTIKLVSLLLEKKDYSILGLISNHFRRIIFCGLSDYSNEELANMLKIKPFAVSKARNQSKLYSKIQLKKILEILEELDFMIKSGKMQYENAIYFLIFNILYI